MPIATRRKTLNSQGRPTSVERTSPPGSSSSSASPRPAAPATADGSPTRVQNVPQLVRVFEAREPLRPFAEATLHQEAGLPIGWMRERTYSSSSHRVCVLEGTAARATLAHSCSEYNARTGRIAKAPARILCGERSTRGFRARRESVLRGPGGMLVAAARRCPQESTFEIASEHLDCRYSTATPGDHVAAEDRSGPLEGVLLPDNDVFRPLLADQREPRSTRTTGGSNSGAVRTCSPREGQDHQCGLVAFGARSHLGPPAAPRLRRGSSEPVRRGLRAVQPRHSFVRPAQRRLSGRAGVDFAPWALVGASALLSPEQSPRDEFLLNYGIAHGVQRQDLSFEILDAIVSVEDTWWRLYAGGGLVVLSSSTPISPPCRHSYSGASSCAVPPGTPGTGSGRRTCVPSSARTSHRCRRSAGPRTRA